MSFMKIAVGDKCNCCHVYCRGCVKIGTRDLNIASFVKMIRGKAACFCARHSDGTVRVKNALQTHSAAFECLVTLPCSLSMKLLSDGHWL